MGFARQDSLENKGPPLLDTQPLLRFGFPAEQFSEFRTRHKRHKTKRNPGGGGAVHETRHAKAGNKGAMPSSAASFPRISPRTIFSVEPIFLRCVRTEASILPVSAIRLADPCPECQDTHLAYDVVKNKSSVL